MDEHDQLVERFEAERPQLTGMAYRMLGSLPEAEDAVQESWLHLVRADRSTVLNLGAWLTTAVARICLNMLRSRTLRREESLDVSVFGSIPREQSGIDPEEEAELADSVGLALLVVLDRLSPAERLAFVLHDIFAIPFEEIASILQREVPATRQLASRARRRVRGAEIADHAESIRSREVARAFLTASREGSFETLLTLLDPDVLFRADRVAMSRGWAEEVRGAASVGRMFTGRTRFGIRFTQLVLVDETVGVVVAPRGRLVFLLRLTIRGGKIAEIEAVADPAHLHKVRLAVPDD